MDVQPAHISQVQVGEDGRVYEISADSSTVAADLQAIDRGLKVRFAERGQCFIVRHEYHDGCPHNAKDEQGRDTRGSYLVKSVQAHQTRSGTWAGLDQRLVDRIRFIHPHGRSGYDYVREIERSYPRREEALRKERIERMGDAAERTAHALRKDLGLGPPKGRIFKPREV